MATDKIEYSRLLMKRTDQTGEVPTIPPVTAVTLNQFIPTDLMIGEMFVNTADDLMWIRTDNGILQISISGSSGSTQIQDLQQVLFQGNHTDGYNIVVNNGDTIVFEGLSTGTPRNYLAVDLSGNTIIAPIPSGSTTGGGAYLPLSGGTVTGATKFTSTFSLPNLTSGGSSTYLTVDSDTGQVYTATNSPSSSPIANISKIALRGWGTGFLVADNKIYTFNGTEGNGNYTRAVDNSTGGGLYGLELMREVIIPNERGTLVDAGSQSTQAYALFDNGNLYMWGWNGQGQLGVGNTTNQFYPVLSTTGVTQVYTHTSQDGRDDDNSCWFIKKTDGKVYGTGYNGFGQLGIGNTTQQNSWVEITAIGTNPVGVWPLGAYTGALVVQKSDNSIWVAGYNGFGQLGLGNTTSTISTLTNTGTAWNGGDTTMVIQEIGFGSGYFDGNTIENTCITMFLDNGTTSRITSSGNNNWGNLGNGGTTQSSSPVLPNIGVGRVRKMVWCGGVAGSCWVLKTDGTLWNWGYGSQGQLDRGNTTQNNPTPQQVETGVLDILIHNHAWLSWNFEVPSPIIRKADGYYRCGYNGYGGVGDGTTTNRTSIVKMRFPEGIELKTIGAISTVNNATTYYAADTRNKLWSWGYNGRYAVYGSSNSEVNTPVQVLPSVLIK
jgi:alpha-tubulin suppressor-like RCC1 family protein